MLFESGLPRKMSGQSGTETASYPRDRKEFGPMGMLDPNEQDALHVGDDIGGPDALSRI